MHRNQLRGSTETYISIFLSHASISHSHATKILGAFRVKISSKSWEGSRDQLGDDVSAHLWILIHPTELLTRQPGNNAGDKFFRQQLVNRGLDTIQTLITGHGIPGSRSTTQTFLHAHEFLLRVVVSRPQHHSNLLPECRQSLHTSFRVASARANPSKQDLHLLSNGLLAREVHAQGADQSLAVLASNLSGGGGSGQQSCEEGENDLHDNYTCCLFRSPH